MAFEPAEALRDKEPRRVLFARRDGEDVGYVGLRREHKWERRPPLGHRHGRHLLRHSCRTARPGAPGRRHRPDGHDQARGASPSTTRCSAGSAARGPPATSRPGTAPGSASSTSARPGRCASYEDDCDVVVEVEDRYAPWNAGRWRLTASGGSGTAARTSDAAEVTLDVAVLGCGLPGTRHRRAAAGGARAGAPRRAPTPSWRGRCGPLVEPEPSIGF